MVAAINFEKSCLGQKTAASAFKFVCAFVRDVMIPEEY